MEDPTPPRRPLIDAAWFATSEVTRVLHAEQRELIPLLTSRIGVRGLYLRPAQGYPRDLSGNMLQCITHLHRRDRHLAGEFIAEDDELPLSADSFSLVYALHVLESANNPSALLNEVARCLQPEGILVCIVFSRWSLWRWRWRQQALQALDSRSVQAACREAGLSIEQRIPLGPVWPWLGGRPQEAASESDSPGWRQALAPWRTSWALVARKRRHGMTPIGSSARLQIQATAGST